MRFGAAEELNQLLTAVVLRVDCDAMSGPTQPKGLVVSRIVLGGLLCALLGSAGPGQTPPRTADQLIAQFRKAHQARAIASMLGLVYWGTAEPEMHRSVEHTIAADSGLVIKRISLQPLAANETLEYTQHGVTYRPTLRPIGRLQVEFLPQPGTDQQQRSTTYLVGVKDGVYFLLTAAPVTR